MTGDMQVATIIMALGLLSCFLPVVPGPAIVWLGALYYAWHTTWREVSVFTIVILLLLALGGSTAELWLGALGAKRSGTSVWGMLAGIAGGIGGMVVGSVPGLIIGSLLAIGAVEYFQHRNWKQVMQAGKGYLAGFLLSIVAQVACCLLMIAVFWLAVRF